MFWLVVDTHPGAVIKCCHVRENIASRPKTRKGRLMKLFYLAYYALLLFCLHAGPDNNLSPVPSTWLTDGPILTSQSAPAAAHAPGLLDGQASELALEKTNPRNSLDALGSREQPWPAKPWRKQLFHGS